MSRNQLITLPDWFGQLAQLQILSLDNNQLTVLPESLGQLAQLQRLSLDSNHITALPDWFGQLAQLQRLSLDNNHITALPDWFGQLAQLQILSLDNNQLTVLPESLGQLAQLQRLSLDSNHITALPDWFGQLAQLQRLSLDSNHITALPDWFGQLAQLQRLSLDNNHITALPDWFGQLAQLQILSLDNNQLTVLPESLGQLAQLQRLSLDNNHITALPDWFGQLAQLQRLSLDNNHITALPDWFGQLAQLQRLSLDNNQLTVLPESLGQLAQLQQLDLSNNQLETVPESLGQLAQLQQLDLSNNQLETVPESLGQLAQLQELYFHSNDALGIPPEILGLTKLDIHGRSVGRNKSTPAAILRYHFQSRQERRPLNEAKLILVGYGAVGKTSLVNRLVHGTFQAGEAKTEGINITPWPLRLHDTEDIQLHIWDFGGQEIMHATHQFFLTQRSLYLLVLNGRQGHEDADAEYWLTLIESFGGEESPVLVVLNKINEQRFDVNRRALQQKFPNIRGFLETDCDDETGIEDLRRRIAAETDHLEHLRDPFPASWFSIKDDLAKMEDNYLTYTEYQQVCTIYQEIDPAAQKDLAGYLHSLGIVLNYADDPQLRDTHVLNPRWVTEGIYKILNYPPLADAHGEIDLRELGEILDSTAYPEDRYLFLFDLMRKFELCFPFPDEDTHYLIPELLDKQQPEEADDFDLNECLNFQYHYPILPEGLLPRFIVRTHVLNRDLARWKTGVLLTFEGNRALVKADLQAKKVIIAITGPFLGRRRLLATIRSDFEHLHLSFKFHPEEMVPVPGHPLVLVPYQELVLMERSRIETFPRVIENEIFTLSVKEMLNGVDLEETRKASQKRDSKSQPLRLFYVYSHKDEVLRNELETRLKILHRQGVIAQWQDRRITAGEKWTDQIDRNIEQADIILLLMSPDFLASDYCYDKELQRALERHDAGEVRVIPIVVREVNWLLSPFSTLQALPKDARAITTWADPDLAWRSVEEGIERATAEIRGQLSSKIIGALLISRLELENIRCFSNVDLEFSSSKGVKQFALILGDNGVGKTTLLRSIAIGLASQTEGTALMSKLPGDMIRQGEQRGLIRIELKEKNRGVSYVVETVLRRNSRGLIELEQTSPKNLSRDQIFICGYGAARHSFGTEDYVAYSLSHAVATLFDYSADLQNPELSFRRIESQDIGLNSLTQRIDAILMLELGATRIDSSGIRIQGPWGDFVPVGALGDGFQSTLSWIADLFGWALFHKQESLLSEISGIVLIDEVEQHLHPRWQREIIKLLHQQFPGIQFITATHSPICVGGLADLDIDLTSMIRIKKGHDGSVHCEEGTSLPGWRYDQILTSEAFELSSPRDVTTSGLIEKLRKVYQTEGGESEELKQVMEELRSRSIHAAEDERERQIQTQLSQDVEQIKEMIRKKGSS